MTDSGAASGIAAGFDDGEIERIAAGLQSGQLVETTALKHVDSSSRTRLLPAEVSIETSGSKRWLVEYYPDPGSCTERWVGVSRRIPLNGDGRPRSNEANYAFARQGTDWYYEKGLEAFARSDYREAFRYLAPACRWSGSMYGAIAVRVQIALKDPLFRAQLEPIYLAPGETVVLRVEPHPRGTPVHKLAGRLRAGHQDPDLLKILTAHASDGYLRIASAGEWDFVVDPKTQRIGFISRRSSRGADLLQTRPDSAFVMAR